MMRASGNGAAIKDDVMEINEQDIAETTKQLLVDARLGQGKFRRELSACGGVAARSPDRPQARPYVLRTYCHGRSRTIKSG